MALLTDVLDFLQAESLVGGATGWTRAAGYLPPTPNKVIAVFETPGPEPEMEKDGSTAVEYDFPRFQIRGRGEEFGYEALRSQMQAIFIALQNSQLAPTTGEPAYLLVRAIQSGPMSLGLDDNSRPGMTWNFECIRERG